MGFLEAFRDFGVLLLQRDASKIVVTVVVVVVVRGNRHDVVAECN